MSDVKLLPRLILPDINMPGMDGIEALKLLKANPESEDIPVILLTWRADAGSEVEGLKLGAVDYVSKPFAAELQISKPFGADILRARVLIRFALRGQRIGWSAGAGSWSGSTEPSKPWRARMWARRCASRTPSSYPFAGGGEKCLEVSGLAGGGPGRPEEES
jgi:DNA-binding response OmpR family regulator